MRWSPTSRGWSSWARRWRSPRRAGGSGRARGPAGGEAMAEQAGEVGASKGPVERRVTRVVTPGTVTDSELLSERQDTVLLAVYASRARVGLAWLPVARGRLGGGGRTA